MRILCTTKFKLTSSSSLSWSCIFLYFVVVVVVIIEKLYNQVYFYFVLFDNYFVDHDPRENFTIEISHYYYYLYSMKILLLIYLFIHSIWNQIAKWFRFI
jgi:hypothetical protein